MRLRGPHVAIAIVAVLLALDYTSYRLWAKWPVQPWMMYAKRAPFRREIAYRRFVAHYRDGRSAATSLAGVLDVATKPYRVDGLLSIDRPGFMLAVESMMGPDVVGLSLEQRSWRYPAKSLERHLAEDAPGSLYRVIEVEPPPSSLRVEVPGDLLRNGRFATWNPRSGKGDSWDVEAYWHGIGITGDADYAGLLVSAPDGSAQVMRQKVKQPGANPLRARALVRAHGDGAALELYVADATTPAASAPVVGDDAWHIVELTLPAHEGQPVTIAVRGARGDTYVDDVSLTAAPP